jgi:TIR domain
MGCKRRFRIPDRDLGVGQILMPPTLFFSYSHVDEVLRNQLEIHLTALQRQGLIATWHDRRITAGSHVGDAIDANLEAAEIILLLVSADFIASDYCYEREMAQAMERHRSGAARVIPVILRPCDWHDLPFGELLACPRDGKPVTTWPNIDEAFLDVERAIKAALKERSSLKKKDTITKQESPVAAEASAKRWSRTDEVPESLAGPRSSNLRVKQEFTELDRDRFRRHAFDFLALFFENSMKELVARNPALRLEQHFERVDGNIFTAAIYKDGRKISKGSASMAGGMMGRDSISYLMNDEPGHGAMNEAVTVKADDQMLYFEPLGMQSLGSRDNQKLSEQGVAELFWEIFIRPIQ